MDTTVKSETLDLPLGNAFDSPLLKLSTHAWAAPADNAHGHASKVNQTMWRRWRADGLNPYMGRMLG